ncbi:MAG TPA: 4-alpha-glucanotransferase, partial [Candidatus Eisenbacteria bacterium]|nr:4-alpha-glucanotransferase [Candidatus Eisenbacteria bacterium]
MPAGAAPAAAYREFLASPCARPWRRIGVRRRSAAATPLFSVWSRKSVGVGELPDLESLAGWCRATGISVIQLLPMNDVGFTFRPYDAESCFAIEPMHLSLAGL